MGTVELAARFALGVVLAQATQVQACELHRLAAAERWRRAAVVEAEHGALGCAQFHHLERRLGWRQARELTLRGQQRDAGACGDGAGFAVERRFGTQAQVRGIGQRPLGGHRKAEHVGTVVLAQPSLGAIVAQGQPFVPGAFG